MPTISFSENFLVSGSDTSSAPTKAIARLICGYNDTTGNINPGYNTGLFDPNIGGWGVSGWGIKNSAIQIMKGVVPTDFSGLTSRDSRSTDILISFGSSNITRQVNTNPAVITTAGVNASASGTATWFWAYSSTLTSNVSPFPTQLRSQIIGNVGPIGSGADLEISDTNIVSGRSYFISKLLIRMPDTITY